jgi:UDP-GlcNAc:undecaprenyl-phosphate GlcNAc-1-phosphate transferase
VSYAFALPIAAGLGAVAAFVARALSLRLRLVSHPNGLVASHTRPVAYLGGPAVAAGALVTVALTGGVADALVAGGLVFLLVGLLDDLRPLAPTRKVTLQAVAAAVPVSMGLALPVSGVPVVDSLAAVLWILLVVNAVNVTDVCDGLVPGLAAIALVALAVVEPETRPLCLAAAGACLGFLVFNAPPASIFLGDSGSHLLGFWLAAPVLTQPSGVRDWETIGAVTVILGVPLLETAFIIVARTRRGVPWWRASAHHFSLRLQAAGLSPWVTDAAAWVAGATLGLAGWAVLQLGGAAELCVIAAVLAGLAAASWLVGRCDSGTGPREALPGGPSVLSREG